MGDCVNYHDGWYHVYNHTADDYATSTLSVREVLDVHGVTPERVERARLNGCSMVKPEDRCPPGRVLVRRGPGGSLIPEDQSEWQRMAQPLERGDHGPKCEGPPCLGVDGQHARSCPRRAWEARQRLEPPA